MGEPHIDITVNNLIRSTDAYHRLSFCDSVVAETARCHYTVSGKRLSLYLLPSTLPKC